MEQQSVNYGFWEMAFDSQAIDITTLREAVITQANPFGDITEAEFKEISKQDFNPVQNQPVAPATPVEKPVENSGQGVVTPVGTVQ